MPSTDPALLKVTAFIMCEREGAVQLLVFWIIMTSDGTPCST